MNSPLPNSPLVTIPSTITIVGAILTVFGIHSHEWMLLVAWASNPWVWCYEFKQVTP